MRRALRLGKGDKVRFTICPAGEAVSTRYVIGDAELTRELCW